jgi:hypothetical protein
MGAWSFSQQLFLLGSSLPDKKLENPGKKNWKAHHSVVMLKKHLLQTYAAQRNNIPILVKPMCKTDVMKETTTKRILDQIANMYP